MMRSLVLVACCVALVPEFVAATACAQICSTTELWGIGSASVNYTDCQCTGTGAARVGTNCGCGGCYTQSGTKVFGFAKDSSTGECPSGMTNCYDCDMDSLSSSGSGSTSSNTTTTTTTNTPTKKTNSSLAPSSTGTTTTSSSSSTAGGTTGSSASNSTQAGSSSSSNSDSSSGLAMWQIALIICSCVVVFAVVMVTITSCYCKARNRMNDGIQMEEESKEYENYWQLGDDRAADEQINNSSFGPSVTHAARSSSTSNQSLPNSTKNTMRYSEPTFAVDGGERPRAKSRGNRHSLDSNADLPGIFQPFAPRDRSGHDVGHHNKDPIEL